MITKIVKVPEREAYPFCKRFFFALLGSYHECFSMCLDQQGWIGYPFYKNEDPRPILILFANYENTLQTAINLGNDNYRLRLIFTDIENNLEADEIIDLTDFEKYYQTELSLGEFINKIFS